MRCGPGMSPHCEKCFCIKGVSAVGGWFGWCSWVEKALLWVIGVSTLNVILKEERIVVFPVRVKGSQMMKWGAMIVRIRG
eukprot:6267494-Ditylum_brightwellii.AAC.1